MLSDDEDDDDDSGDEDGARHARLIQRITGMNYEQGYSTFSYH